MEDLLSGIARLESRLGPERIWTGNRIPAVYRRDMLQPNRAFPVPEEGWPPAAVVRPDSTEAVAAALRAIRECGLRVVPWGGGTNIMGSAAALKGEVLLDLGGLNQVLEIDPFSRRVRVQAGASLKAVEESAAPHGLLLGHDPWTFSYATVGGAISTDGLGYLAPRYGSMGQRVLGLTMVLPDGTVATRRPVERASGFNLATLAVGMEGTLGIVTEAVLRLSLRPERQEIVAFRFPDFASGFHAAIDVSELGPALLDLIEPFAEGSRHFPDDDGDESRTLYLGFEGPAAVVEAQLKEAEEAVAAHGGERRNPEIAREYWEGRHEIADWVARDSSGRSKADDFVHRFWFDYVHVALPRGKVLEYRTRALETLKRHAVLPTEAGVFVHPELFNLHFLKPRGTDEASERREMNAAFEELITGCHALGGSMEYCHGIGTRLCRFLADELGAGLGACDRIKWALDPDAFLPTLGRRPLG
jgi:FAD/FMN-containing dehydrogenase